MVTVSMATLSALCGRIEDLRSVSGINVVGIKIILNLSNRVEELRSIVMDDGLPNP
jgi:hypothetical protein